MHLVFATSIVPDGAPATGYEIANASIVAALKRAGARVSILGYAWPGGVPADPDNTIVLGEVDVRTDAASALGNARWLASALASGMTFSSAKLRIVPPRKIHDILAGLGRVDAVVLNSVQLAGAYEEVFENRPTIFVAHNVEHRSATENASAARNPFKRMLYRREASLLKALEERLCRRAGFVFTLAEEDRALLGMGEEKRSATLPLTTGAETGAPSGGRETDCDAALVGTWTWQPNRIGLEWFLKEVMPLLDPEFRVRIAGRMPAGLKSDHPGVEFVGKVPDAVSFIRSAAVVPLVSRAGTGVQLKTIETFELGLPSVATTRSLRGISYFPSNCTVTDDPAAFATALRNAVKRRVPDVDGSTFRDAQLMTIDSRIRSGLEHALAATNKQRAAA